VAGDNIKVWIQYFSAFIIIENFCLRFMLDLYSLIAKPVCSGSGLLRSYMTGGAYINSEPKIYRRIEVTLTW